MAIIKSANSAEMARDAVVLDLGDLYRQGQLLVQQAKERAEAIVDEAEAERERLITGATELGRVAGFAKGSVEGRAAGFIEGQAAGLAERREALCKIEAGWKEVLGHVVGERERLLADARRDVIRLAATMAEKVTKRAIELDERIVVAQLEAVLGLVLRSSRLVVTVHPADRQLVADALPGLLPSFQAVQHAELAEDATLERGSCKARISETMGGEIDASIRTQLDRIVEALLPGNPDGAVGTGGAGGAEGGAA